MRTVELFRGEVNPFIPAHQDGEVIGASATINMSWRLTQ
jgi:hypothetical protein